MHGKYIDRIKALLNRAGHPNTPIEEARSCALIAAQLFYKHQFYITNTDPQVEHVSPGIHDNDPWKDAVTYNNPDLSDSDNWDDVETFRTVISKGIGICKACGKTYNKGVVIAYTREKGSTHHGCRRFWTDGQVR